MIDFELQEVVRNPKGEDKKIIQIRRANGLPEYLLEGGDPFSEWHIGVDLTKLDAEGNPVPQRAPDAQLDARTRAYRGLVKLYSYHSTDTRFTDPLDAIKAYLDILEGQLNDATDPVVGTAANVTTVLLGPDGQPLDVPPGEIMHTGGAVVELSQDNPPDFEAVAKANSEAQEDLDQPTEPAKPHKKNK